VDFSHQESFVDLPMSKEPLTSTHLPCSFSSLTSTYGVGDFRDLGWPNIFTTHIWTKFSQLKYSSNCVRCTMGAHRSSPIASNTSGCKRKQELHERAD
jgi:hypothetical protein